MSKGVNKKVIEVNDTGNMYFEKAILYVRPKMLTLPQKHLMKEAKYYLNENLPVYDHNEEKFLRIKRFAVTSAVFCVILSTIIVGLMCR